MHVPVYTFDIYLTGYDVQAINVRDLINGELPRTASVGQDPTDTSNNPDGISNQGPLSQDINFATCNGSCRRPRCRRRRSITSAPSLTGQQSPLTGMCATKRDGTRIARGYITVDTTNQCTSLTPADPGYFVAGGGGIATNQNVLWGDYTYTNHIGGLESGDGSPLVHITANATDPQTSVPGEYTFYGRFVAWTAADNREPLSTNFMTRFVNLPSAGQTTLTVWRDAKVNQDYFACGATPAWYPLAQEALGFFDEQENPEIIAASPFPPPPPAPTVLPFGFGAQRVADWRIAAAHQLQLRHVVPEPEHVPGWVDLAADDPARRAGVRVRSSQGRGPLQHGLAGDHAGFREGAEPFDIPGSSDMTAMSLVKSEVGSMRFRYLCLSPRARARRRRRRPRRRLADRSADVREGPALHRRAQQQWHQRAARRRPDPAPD